MSRRHHRRPHHHAHGATEAARPTAGVNRTPLSAPENDPPAVARALGPRSETLGLPARSAGGVRQAPFPAVSLPGPRAPVSAMDLGPNDPSPFPTTTGEASFPTAAGPGSNGHLPAGQPPAGQPPAGFSPSPGTRPEVQPPGLDRNTQCTSPQLRRFIKSRPYVPMHELRRRFGIEGADDDVTPVRVGPGWIYVGLPCREGLLLGELLRAGEIGYELSLDPRTPIVIGVYPMRPIPRN